jgi:hypothetical protein
MESQTQLWNQYQNLREEIRGADSLNYQIMGIVVGAAAALLTTAIREGDLPRKCQRKKEEVGRTSGAERPARLSWLLRDGLLL